MTCERCRRLALLADAGDATQEDRNALEAHLAGCEACRRETCATRRLVAVARTALDADGPSPAVLAAIRSEARRRVARRPVVFRRPELRPLAAAAALLVIAGGALWFVGRRPTGAERIDEARAVLALLAGDAVAREEPAAIADTHEERLQSLARQLLRMEGLHAEDASDLAPWEPEPTAPQSRSTPGPRAKRCV